MSGLWGPLVAADWRNTPALKGRAATAADVDAGIAVFYIPNGSVPHPIPLPVCAIHRDVKGGEAIPVVVIQAEESRGKVFLGARPLRGGSLVCTLEEVKFVDKLDERFFK